MVSRALSRGEVGGERQARPEGGLSGLGCTCQQVTSGVTISATARSRPPGPPGAPGAVSSRLSRCGALHPLCRPTRRISLQHTSCPTGRSGVGSDLLSPEAPPRHPTPRHAALRALPGHRDRGEGARGAGWGGGTQTCGKPGLDLPPPPDHFREGPTGLPATHRSGPTGHWSCPGRSGSRTDDPNSCHPSGQYCWAWRPCGPGAESA